MQKRRFFVNAVILTSTSILMNSVSVSFSVYISNKIGAAGVGLFQLIMSLYGFSVTLATSGINLAATRLVTDELASGKNNAAAAAMRKCITYSLFFGVFAATLLYTNSDFIARFWLRDIRVVSSLRTLSVSMPFIAVSEAISGYFMAVRRLAKSSSAKVLEQAINITFTIIALESFIHKGIEYACLCIVAGGSIAEISSFIYVYILYVLDKRRYRSKSTKKGLYRQLLSISLPVAASAYLRSGLLTIEHLMIPRGLEKSGMSSNAALSGYGQVHGMAIPVLLFPSAILRSLSSLLVPELSECRRRGHTRQINHIASRIIKIAMLFAICISGIFFFFSTEISSIIYKNGEVGIYIQLLAPLTIVMYVDGIVDGMLKGLNQQVYSMNFNIIDSAVSIILLFFLLPRYGIMGYIAVIYISELINGFLSLNRLIRITDFKVNYFSWLLIPLISMYVATSIVKWIAQFVYPLTTLAIGPVSLQISAAVLTYILLLYTFSCIEPFPSMETMMRNLRH